MSAEKFQSASPIKPGRKAQPLGEIKIVPSFNPPPRSSRGGRLGPSGKQTLARIRFNPPPRSSRGGSYDHHPCHRSDQQVSIRLPDQAGEEVRVLESNTAVLRFQSASPIKPGRKRRHLGVVRARTSFNPPPRSSRGGSVLGVAVRRVSESFNPPPRSSRGGRISSLPVSSTDKLFQSASPIKPGRKQAGTLPHVSSSSFNPPPRSSRGGRSQAREDLARDPEGFNPPPPIKPGRKSPDQFAFLLSDHVSIRLPDQAGEEVSDRSLHPHIHLVSIRLPDQAGEEVMSLVDFPGSRGCFNPPPRSSRGGSRFRHRLTQACQIGFNPPPRSSRGGRLSCSCCPPLDAEVSIRLPDQAGEEGLTSAPPLPRRRVSIRLPDQAGEEALASFYVGWAIEFQSASPDQAGEEEELARG